MQGTVYRSTGSWYIVKAHTTNLFWKARLKGAFKVDGITSTNPIAVGDVVEMDIDDEQAQIAIIHAIHDRKNYVARQSPSHRKQHHIIASNVDQSLLFATLKDPKTSTGFIDRFLVSCEAFHVPAIIVFNKVDLYRKKELELLEDLAATYEEIGYAVFATSVKDAIGLEAIHDVMKGKRTLVSGHSGVGKSSFLNAIYPDLQLRTKEVSNWSGKGMHTTTFAEMFDLSDGGEVIDTPGIRELGLVHITPQELSHYFPEMRDRLQQCQFNNCSHVHEPGCAIKAALAKGEIAESRWLSYAGLLDEVDKPDWD